MGGAFPRPQKNKEVFSYEKIDWYGDARGIADFHNYIVPQSTGNHTDVRSVDFNGDLLTVTSDRLFQFSAVPYSDENIQAAKHIKDLAGDGMVTVHLDAEQTGVGTATCGPDILPKYRLPIEPTEFIFFFKVK